MSHVNGVKDASARAVEGSPSAHAPYPCSPSPAGNPSPGAYCSLRGSHRGFPPRLHFLRRLRPKRRSPSQTTVVFSRFHLPRHWCPRKHTMGVSQCLPSRRCRQRLDQRIVFCSHGAFDAPKLTCLPKPASGTIQKQKHDPWTIIPHLLCITIVHIVLSLHYLVGSHRTCTPVSMENTESRLQKP